MSNEYITVILFLFFSPRPFRDNHRGLLICLTLSFHNSLSKASHLCSPPLAKSSASCSAYIHLGLPLALLPSQFPPHTLLTNLFPSILIRCPSHSSLLQQTLSSNDLILT